jgi:hypothetical protein
MDANGRPRRIHLTKGAESRYEEGRAGATIMPGMLIALNSSAVYVPHPTADGGSEVCIALEDALQGRTIDDAYASGELVRFIIPVRGDVVLALLEAGQNVTDGTKLVSNGAGYVQAQTGEDADAILVALEDRNANDTGAEIDDQRIRCRVL